MSFGGKVTDAYQKEKNIHDRRQQQRASGVQGKTALGGKRGAEEVGVAATKVGDDAWHAATRQDGVDESERVLRAFDLSSKYGPCTGMTRMARWERAEKLGLGPPDEVRALLVKLGSEGQALWDGRV